MNDRLVYLDNAATTFPKSREVLNQMVETYCRLGASPGRGSYDLSAEAEEFVAQTRQKLANFFNAPDPERVIFSSNATDALNIAIQGIVEPGDHVVSTRLEHNSVLRTLYHLKQRNWINYDLVPFDEQGLVDPGDIRKAIRPNTKLVIVCHASNVLGTIQPLAKIGRVCAEHDINLLVDAAQSAGQILIDMAAWNISALAFTGHKALLGPSGTGGLLLAREVKINVTKYGGTGIDSQKLIHTQTFPHRLEAGTQNLLGIIGISAALDYLGKKGLVEIRKREMDMFIRLRKSLATLNRVTFYTPFVPERNIPLAICNIKGLSSVDLASILDGDYNIAVRAGLQCAPLVHRDLGTSPTGAIRLSIGHFNTGEDIDDAVSAIKEICESLERK